MLHLVLSSRTDFFVDMSGQISSRQLSPKQWSGNKHSDVPTKIQTSSYAMDHWDWPGKQWRAERQACRCTHLTARLAFWKAFYLNVVFEMYPFFFKIVHYYVDKTESLSTCHIFSKLLFCPQFCRQSTCQRQH